MIKFMKSQERNKLIQIPGIDSLMTFLRRLKIYVNQPCFVVDAFKI